MEGNEDSVFFTEDQEDLAEDLHTIQDYLRLAQSEFSRSQIHFGHGTHTIQDEALYLVLGALSLSLEEIPLEFLSARLSYSERIRLIALLRRRILERVPVPYLIGFAYFRGLKFYVDPRVLIPRSPIAEWIARDFSPWVQDKEEIRTALDMCTGSGCLAVLIALAFENAQVDAVDIIPEALEVTRLNAQKHHVSSRISCIQSDLFAELSQKEYDIIVCNPPYVSSSEYEDLPLEYYHEPILGLVAEQDGLALAYQVLQVAFLFLKPNGFLVLEVGNKQRELSEYLTTHHIMHTWLECEEGAEGVCLIRKEDWGKY